MTSNIIATKEQANILFYLSWLSFVTGTTGIYYEKPILGLLVWIGSIFAINYWKNPTYGWRRKIFIDGDHSYNGVKNDYEISKNSGKIFVFHDIINDVCPCVVQFWNELKNNEKNTYNFFEFTEQYEDVWNDTHQKFLGIGVAIKKNI